MLDRDEDHFIGKIAQKALIINDNSILLVRHVGNGRTWELPGGRLNKNEDPKIGLAREIMEELGVVIVVGDAISIEPFVMKRTNEQHLAIVYKAKLTDPGMVFKVAADEVVEVAWVTAENWQEYQLFDNYARVLEVYFKNGS